MVVWTRVPKAERVGNPLGRSKVTLTDWIQRWERITDMSQTFDQSNQMLELSFTKHERTEREACLREEIKSPTWIY